MRVNMIQTKFLISGAGLDVLKDTGKFPSAVCRKGVGAHSILSTGCPLWFLRDAVAFVVASLFSLGSSAQNLKERHSHSIVAL